MRVRLLSVTVAMVALVVVLLVALNLNSLISAWVDSAANRAEARGKPGAGGYRAPVAEQTCPGRPRRSPIRQVKDLWMQAIANDQDLATQLEQTMAQSQSIIEIGIAGEDGKILASTNPDRIGTQMRTDPICVA